MLQLHANAVSGQSRRPKASGCAAPNFIVTLPMRSITAGNMPFGIADQEAQLPHALAGPHQCGRRAAGMTYSRFMEGLKAAKVQPRPQGSG